MFSVQQHLVPAQILSSVLLGALGDGLERETVLIWEESGGECREETSSRKNGDSYLGVLLVKDIPGHYLIRSRGAVYDTKWSLKGLKVSLLYWRAHRRWVTEWVPPAKRQSVEDTLRGDGAHCFALGLSLSTPFKGTSWVTHGCLAADPHPYPWNTQTHDPWVLHSWVMGYRHNVVFTYYYTKKKIHGFWWVMGVSGVTHTHTHDPRGFGRPLIFPMFNCLFTSALPTPLLVLSSTVVSSSHAHNPTSSVFEHGSSSNVIDGFSLSLPAILGLPLEKSLVHERLQTPSPSVGRAD
ncbi:hypothetical protein CPC08DRAFT_793353 [Agrocybe pediades]|nr:hypothetical protein CPC08DRAFT_793353 [Agrocybe pediades]